MQTISEVSLNDELFDGASDYFNGLGSFIQVPPNETASVFERFPEVFTDDQDGRAGNTYYTPNGELSNSVSIYGQLAQASAIDPDQSPYSYMVEYPGQIPKTLLSPEREWTVKTWERMNRHPRYVARVPIVDYHAYNIEGEKALEFQIKSHHLDPVTYLLLVRGFKLLLTIRNMTIYGRAMYVSLLRYIQQSTLEGYF